MIYIIIFTNENYFEKRLRVLYPTEATIGLSEDKIDGKIHFYNGKYYFIEYEGENDNIIKEIIHEKEVKFIIPYGSSGKMTFFTNHLPNRKTLTK